MTINPEILEWSLGLLYLLVGPGAVGVLIFLSIKSRSRMTLLERPAMYLPQPAPRATIIVPVKDERARIEACVRSLLAQDYPAFDVIVVDDRSADGTGEILDKLDAEIRERQPGKLRVLHVRDGELPPGRMGKPNALSIAMRHVASDDGAERWLLFVDSDVLIEPDALRASVALSAHREIDLLSLMPRIESGSIFEAMTIPLAGAVTHTLFAVPLTNSAEHDHIAFANGQFLLIRRSTYERVGGHLNPEVMGSMSEDVQLAKLLKRNSFRPRVSLGAQFCSVRMYDSPAAVMRGWARNFYSGVTGKPGRLFVAAMMFVACGLSMYPAIAFAFYRAAHPLYAIVGGLGWGFTAVLHWGLLTFWLAMIYGWSGLRAWLALLFPISSVILLAILARAIWTCYTGRVTWRGTSYERAKA